MYKVYSDNVLLYDDTVASEELILLKPKLVLEDSAAGSFTATIPPTNIHYNDIYRLTSWIKIYRDGSSNPLWEGRVMEEEEDFWKCRKITCEGFLAVLNDTIQPPMSYINLGIGEYIEALLQIHNSKVSDEKKIFRGYVTVTDQYGNAEETTNYETTLECINKLVDTLGGHLRIRYEYGKHYLDYLADYVTENSQTIEFGKNLLDFTKSFTLEDFCTVVTPRGEQLDDSPYENVTAYVDVSSVNDGSISVHLTNADYLNPPDILPVDQFGWIEKVIDFEGVTDPTTLLFLAKLYLTSVQFEKMCLEVDALDLHYADVSYESIHLLDLVRVISKPHGLDRQFPVTKLEIPLDSPEDTTFTLGSDNQVSLTSANKTANDILSSKIEQVPTMQQVLNQFRSEAASMLNNAITGYFTVIQNENLAQEVIFSDTPNYKDSKNGVWRWNFNGLGFQKKYGDDDVVLALTNDGKINADLIATGTLIADIIKAGYLRDWKDGQTFYLDIANGILKIRNLGFDESGKLKIYAYSLDETGQLIQDYQSRVEVGPGLISLYANGDEKLRLDENGAVGDVFIANSSVHIGDFFWEAYSKGLRLV